MTSINALVYIDQIVNTAQHVAVFVLQSAVICAAGLLLAASLKKRGPFVRSIVYRMTLVSIASVGIFGLLGVQLPMHVVSLPDAQTIPVPMHVAVHPRTYVLGGFAHPVVSSLPIAAAAKYVEPPIINFTVEQSSTEMSAQQWALSAFLLIWMIGSVGLLFRTVSAYRHLCKLRRTATRAENVSFTIPSSSRSWQALPVVLTSSEVSSPFLCGIFRPTVFLPSGLYEQLDPSEIDAIVRHEGVHILRNDCAWRFVLYVISSVIWMSPLVWLLSRRLDRASEECVDQIVLSTGCAPKEYANTLVRVVESWAPGQREVLVGSGVVSEESEVRARIVEILRYKALPPPIRTGMALGFLCFAVGCTAAAMALVNNTTNAWTAPPGYMSHFTEAGFPGAHPVGIVNGASPFPSPMATWLELVSSTPLPYKYTDPELKLFTIPQTIWSPHTEPTQLSHYAMSEIRRAQKMIRESRAPAFYAEYVVASRYLTHGDNSNGAYWLHRSLQHAPAIMVGRSQCADGHPDAMDPVTVLVSQNPGSKNASEFCGTYNTVTDKDGRYVLPMYCGPTKILLISRHGQASLGVYSPNNIGNSPMDVGPSTNIVPPFVISDSIRSGIQN